MAVCETLLLVLSLVQLGFAVLLLVVIILLLHLELSNEVANHLDDIAKALLATTESDLIEAILKNKRKMYYNVQRAPCAHRVHQKNEEKTLKCEKQTEHVKRQQNDDPYKT